MWRRGLWLVPVRVMAGLALARLEYENVQEPPLIIEFRSRFGGLDHFTWVPVDGDPAQHVFLRRHFDRANSSFDLEMLVWDRLEDNYRIVTIDQTVLTATMAVLQDMNAPDKRRASVIRQDRRRVLSREKVDDKDQPTWYQFEGRWYKEELAYNRFVREGAAAAKTMKTLKKGEGGVT